MSEAWPSRSMRPQKEMPVAQKEFIRNAREYIDLLRDHIRKEDHCLFAMANNAFTEQDQQTLLAAFENVEAKEIGPGVHDKYLKIADDLAKHYGVALVHGEKASGMPAGADIEKMMNAEG